MAVQLVAVGACYLDTILDVPRFIHEDEKLRATQLSRRRGGNCANTIEVLQQLVLQSDNTAIRHEDEGGQRADRQGGSGQGSIRIQSHLVSVLPRRGSAAVKTIEESLGCDYSTVLNFGTGIGGGGEGGISNMGNSMTGTNAGMSGRDISLEHCVYRSGHEEPASSYIIRSEETGSRSIVNYNALPEMSVDEFKGAADAIARSATRKEGERKWFHFEGRVPVITLKCMEYIRATYPAASVSVEIEKPGREGMLNLVGEADVVFYSRGWALGQGYQDYEECLRDQAKLAPKAKLLCCTWGQSGAAAIQPCTATYAHRHAWASEEPCTVDTIGAGDTFTAGMLYACMVHDEDWDLGKKLEFANELAGRKVVQEGFGGLGSQMEGWL